MPFLSLLQTDMQNVFTIFLHHPLSARGWLLSLTCMPFPVCALSSLFAGSSVSPASPVLVPWYLCPLCVLYVPALFSMACGLSSVLYFSIVISLDIPLPAFFFFAFWTLDISLSLKLAFFSPSCCCVGCVWVAVLGTLKTSSLFFDCFISFLHDSGCGITRKFTSSLFLVQVWLQC